jgi:hypothetical protein
MLLFNQLRRTQMHVTLSAVPQLMASFANASAQCAAEFPAASSRFTSKQAGAIPTTSHSPSLAITANCNRSALGIGWLPSIAECASCDAGATVLTGFPVVIDIGASVERRLMHEKSGSAITRSFVKSAAVLPSG